MGEYRIVAQDELYHSKAHKYIKREWKNGHWQYYYDLPSGNKIQLHSKHAYADSAYTKSLTSKSSDYKKTIRARYNVRKDIDERISKNLKDPNQSEYHEHDKQQQVSNRREMAAYAQELSRLEEAERNRKFKNRVKKWFSKAVTTKTSVSSAKSKKKGQKWLSKVLSTTKSTTIHGFGTTTTKKH